MLSSIVLSEAIQEPPRDLISFLKNPLKIIASNPSKVIGHTIVKTMKCDSLKEAHTGSQVYLTFFQVSLKLCTSTLLRFSFRARETTQWVKCLLCEQEGLSSNPSPHKETRHSGVYLEPQCSAPVKGGDRRIWRKIQAS